MKRTLIALVVGILVAYLPIVVQLLFFVPPDNQWSAFSFWAMAGALLGGAAVAGSIAAWRPVLVGLLTNALPLVVAVFVVSWQTRGDDTELLLALPLTLGIGAGGGALGEVIRHKVLAWRKPAERP